MPVNLMKNNTQKYNSNPEGQNLLLTHTTILAQKFYIAGEL